MSRSWLYLSVPIAIAALALLGWTIASLLRTVRGSVVLSVPIRAEQKLAFEGDGDFSLNIESPIGALRPSGLRYALTTADGAMRIPLAPLELQTDVTSMTRARLELYAFTLPHTGDYTLLIDGVDPAASYSADTVVITRRYGVALVLHVVALLALSGAFIGSIVFSALVFTRKI
jgi:hypothetical protein